MYINFFHEKLKVAKQNASITGCSEIMDVIPALHQIWLTSKTTSEIVTIYLETVLGIRDGLEALHSTAQLCEAIMI